ncbi:putative protein L728 [Ceratocystis platani]|uniref:Uncharacterized protein n=1 Tax=Ceratocystis fimbriata f. sp. platani TaxID=88771 RepID=A0A0F8DLH8_CERFI|nr:putative protein L728 [Ceratocystis platani]
MSNHWFLKSNFPVSFPYDELVGASHERFVEALINNTGLDEPYADIEDGFSNYVTTAKGIHAQSRQENPEESDDDSYDGSFWERENDHDCSAEYSLTKVIEIHKGTSIRDMTTRLEEAWAKEPLHTLRFIFYIRSIHIGKADRKSFNFAAGWLYRTHPRTLAANVHWLARPLVAKILEENSLVNTDFKENWLATDDCTLQTAEDEFSFDLDKGLPHGCWKDLLNILAMAITGAFSPNQKIKESPFCVVTPVGFVESKHGKKKPRSAKHRSAERAFRHGRAVHCFTHNARYRALHIAVARAFVAQLTRDLAALNSTDEEAKRSISMCAKWAPSNFGFHDKQTIIVSTIAEAMYPESAFADEIAADLEAAADPEKRRVRYLWLARDKYRRDISALRDYLQVVERFMSAGKWQDIDYDSLPTATLRNYTGLFLKHDRERFMNYVKELSEGKSQSRNSQGILSPGLLVKDQIDALSRWNTRISGHDVNINKAINNGKWRTMVQHVKELGTLAADSIAICQVIRTMHYEGYYPGEQGVSLMDYTVGFTLLTSELCPGAFGGKFITYDSDPELHEFDMTKEFSDRLLSMRDINQCWSIDYVAVFEKVLLTTAIREKVPPEEMPKRVFSYCVESFQNGAEYREWADSVPRLREMFEAAGYKMPQLIVWDFEERATPGYSSMKEDKAGVISINGCPKVMIKAFLSGPRFPPRISPEDAEGSCGLRRDDYMDMATRDRSFGMLCVLD